MVGLSTPSIVGSIIVIVQFNRARALHIKQNQFETGKFRPEIWSAASSNNASEAGRGLSPFSHFCLVVRDLC